MKIRSTQTHPIITACINLRNTLNALNSKNSDAAQSEIKSKLVMQAIYALRLCTSLYCKQTKDNQTMSVLVIPGNKCKQYTTDEQLQLVKNLQPFWPLRTSAFQSKFSNVQQLQWLIIINTPEIRNSRQWNVWQTLWYTHTIQSYLSWL